jgi:type III secretory pathway component EscV
VCRPAGIAMVRKIVQRVQRSGFFIFFFALFIFAIGVTQDFPLLRDIGLAIVIVIVLTIIIRARRDISTKPKRPQSTDKSKPT